MATEQTKQPVAYIWYGKDAIFAKDFDIIQAINPSSFFESLKKKKISACIKIVQDDKNKAPPPASFIGLFET